MKSFLPTHCPACGYKLVIEQGDKEDTLKLMCKNPEGCSGSNLKRLQKGIVALDIKGLGPKVIEKLLNAGITSSVDLFNPNKFNEKSLIESGEFVKGRALEKIMISVKSTKSVPLHKFILSLQIDDVGKTVSEKLAQLMSGMKPDFAGLPYVVRDNISELTTKIKGIISEVEGFGLQIIKVEPKKVVAETDIKKVTKKISIETKATQEIKDIVSKLGWEIVPVCAEDCDFLIVEDKNNLEQPDWISQIGRKVMTIKQIKLLFV
jgi:NAD-dependent DNA ligase